MSVTEIPPADSRAAAAFEDEAAGNVLAEAAADQQHPTLLKLRSSVAIETGASRGVIWTGGARAVVQMVQFIGTIATARLLLPSDYGKSAIVFSITTFAAIFTDLGLGSSVIHARRVDERLLSSTFWLSLFSGVFLTGLISGVAVPISLFYGQPELAPLIILASLNFTIDSDIVQTALLERTLRFRQLAIVETTCSCLTIIVMVAAAAAGAGVYSLVMGPLAGNLLQAVWLWTTVGWRPRRWIDRSSISQIWAFTRGITGFNILNYWARNLDNLLLGKFASQAALGDYTRSYSLMMLPVTQMGAALGRTIFPALSRLRDEPRRLRSAWTGSIAMAAIVTVPISIGIAVSAPALVHTLYGPRWDGMVPVLQLLALSAPPQLLSAPTGPLMRATGNTDGLFRLGAFTSGVSVIAIVAGLHWGIIGVAMAVLVKSWLLVPVVLVVSVRAARCEMRHVLLPLRGVVFASLMLALTGVAVRWAFGAHSREWYVLLAQIGASSVAYVVTLLIVDRKLLWRTVEKLLPERLRPQWLAAASGNVTPGRPAAGTVLYLLRSYPTLSQTFVRDEIAALRRLGVDVTVVSLSAADLTHIPEDWAGRFETLGQPSALRGLRDLAYVTRAHPARVIALARMVWTFRRGPRRVWLIQALGLARSINRADRRVAAVHTHFAFDSALAVLYLGTLLDVPVRITVHAADIFRVPDEAVERLRYFDEVITVCHFNRDFLVAHGLREVPIHVVPCGVELPPITDVSPLPIAPRTSIVSVGRLVPKKGFPVLLRAFSLVVQSQPLATLTIVGDGPEREALERLALELGISTSVAFLGALSSAEVKQLIAQADVFSLACSIVSDGDTDAVPVAIREAMSYARPVVTTWVAGIPETIDNSSGWVVEPDNSDELATALIDALVSYKAIWRAGAARARIAEEFTLERSARQLKAILDG